jgi:protocatechuate 3,4-dioxygenase beta subunit
MSRAFPPERIQEKGEPPMRNLTEQNVTEAVLAQLADCPDPRRRRVLESLVRHLHAFVREVEPSPEEWMAGIEFLTETGQKCDRDRQEFILLSDILGVSILVDAIHNRKPAGATESSVLGPFYRAGAPERPRGADLASGAAGPRVTVSGRVMDTEGRPIPGAELDVWQTAPDGRYHMQDPSAPAFHLCGRLRADGEGRFLFETLKPVSYPIPTDGPAGRLLLGAGRHPYRPAHIHFIVSASGHKSVVTQLFTEGDGYLDSDAVFGVKGSLVVRYREDGSGPGGAPRYRLEHDFVLERDLAPGPR